MKITIKKTTFLQRKKQRRKDTILSAQLEILSKNLELKALYLLMNQDFKIIKSVFMPGQKKGEKFMVSKRKKRGKRENLLAGRRKKEEDLIGQILFKGSLNAVGFEQ